MDEATLSAIWAALATVIAAVLGLITQWLSDKKGEAYDQGDLIIKQAQDEMRIADGLAQVFPELAAPVAALKDALATFQKGWEDKSFTTMQMMQLKADLSTLVADIAAVVKSKVPAKAG